MAHESIRIIRDEHAALAAMLRSLSMMVKRGPGDEPEKFFDVLRAMLDINLLAPGMLLAAALPYLKSGASVINISSGNAVLPPRGAAIYGASKAALNLWTRGMAKELGPKGIRVNAVAPGATNLPEAPRSPELTQLFVNDTALGRIGTPLDVARAVRFLAGDDAGFIGWRRRAFGLGPPVSSGPATGARGRRTTRPMTGPGISLCRGRPRCIARTIRFWAGTLRR